MENVNKQKLITILGPTATGKSNLAVELALAHNGEIISADSRQVYTGLDIGSGKITTEEMRGVPHHMLDIVDPQENFSVAEFKEQAQAIIADIHARNKVPILVGGTGFYIDAVVFNIDMPRVPPNTILRAELEAKSTTELFTELQEKDPARAETIDPKNKVRLVRALEIINALGKVPEQAKSESIYNTLFIGLDLSDAELQSNIRTRILRRYEQGMIEEVEDLHGKGLSWERMEALGLEYRYISRFIRNLIPSQEALTELLTTKTWQFARRQRMWFKRNEKIHWFHPGEDPGEIGQLTENFLLGK